jgi:tripartite-type tricarboxylate transporter receptor subunit TctC
LQLKTGIVLNGVPYKGGAPMVTDLLGGHLPLGSDLLANFIQLAKDNKVRLLSVATTRRFGDLPDLPTVQELIQQPFEAAAWFAIMARTGTPPDIVQKVNAIANRYLQSAEPRSSSPRPGSSRLAVRRLTPQPSSSSNSSDGRP